MTKTAVLQEHTAREPYLLFAPEPFSLASTVLEIADRRNRSVNTVTDFQGVLRALESEATDVVLLSPAALHQMPEAGIEILKRVAGRVMIVAFVDASARAARQVANLTFASAILLATDVSQRVAWTLERLLDQPRGTDGKSSQVESSHDRNRPTADISEAVFADPIDDQLAVANLAQQQIANGRTTAALRVTPYQPGFPITYASVGTQAILGYAPDQLVGQPLRCLFGIGRDRPGELQKLDDILHTGRAFAETLTVHNSQKSEISVRLQMRPYYSTWGVLQSFVGLMWPTDKPAASAAQRRPSMQSQMNQLSMGQP